MKQKLYAFVQGWGIYPVETMVIVGTRNKDHVRSLMRACKVKKEVIHDVYLWLEQNQVGAESDNGQYLSIDAGGCVFSAIFLKEWPKKATWKNYQTLMHEIHHAVNDSLVERRGMGKEWEAQAYAHEWLFEKMRRKLDGVDKFDKYVIK